MMFTLPLFAIAGKIGVTELILILVVVLVIFGPKNLPKLAGMFGKTVKNFKEGMEENLDEEKDAAAEAAKTTVQEAEKTAEIAAETVKETVEENK